MLGKPSKGFAVSVSQKKETQKRSSPSLNSNVAVTKTACTQVLYGAFRGQKLGLVLLSVTMVALRRVPKPLIKTTTSSQS